ncbi:MAG: hypothetical protein HOY71_27635 [Nonomuraea sp.]|nr:hypothetical protein [Nonomuraea sp.]
MHDNVHRPMPGTVRFVQVLLWISVVLAGFMGAVTVLGILAGGADVFLLYFAIMAVVFGIFLWLAVKIPSRRAGVRTGVLVLYGLALAYEIISVVNSGIVLDRVIALGLAVTAILCMLSSSAKEYFTG